MAGIEGFTRLDDPELTLPGDRYGPLAGRSAWQCDICRGIFYPNGDDPVECPYCAEDEDAA